MELMVVLLRYIDISINLILEIMTKSIIVPNEFVRNRIANLTEIINKFQQENPSMFVFLTTIFICLSYVGIICLYTLEFAEGNNNNAKEKIE